MLQGSRFECRSGQPGRTLWCLGERLPVFPPRSDASSRPVWSSSARSFRRRWARRKAASSRPARQYRARQGVERRRFGGAERPDVPPGHSLPAGREATSRRRPSSGLPTTSVVTAPSRRGARRLTSSRAWPSFLAGRGLELSQAKTRIVHIDDGFDFLGFNLRHLSRWRAAGRGPEGARSPASQRGFLPSSASHRRADERPR